MLYFIIAWAFLTVLCYVIGTNLLNTFKADCFEQRGDRFIIAVWLGVVVLCVSLLTTSLVLPLSSLVGLGVSVILVSLSLLSRQTRTEVTDFSSNLSLNLIGGFFTLEVVVASLTSQQVTWIDTGLYHFGAIHWLSEYGAVPGVALIQNRFGWTSSWFALAAPFHSEIFGDRVSAITNGFALLITILHFLLSIGHIFTKKAKLADWLVIISSFIILPMLMIRSLPIVNKKSLMSIILVSPSPDIPILLLTLVVAWTILIISDTNKLLWDADNNFTLDARIIPLILAAGAVTMKPTAFPLLPVVGLFYLSGKNLSIQRIFSGIIILFLLLFPMLIFGIITSGCPLFPSSFMCLDLPWSVIDKEQMARNVGIAGWWKWFGSPPSGENYLLWVLTQWFKNNLLNQLMVVLLIVSVMFAIWILKTAKIREIWGHIWVIAIGVTGIAFIMIVSPIIRFGLGYFLLIPALLVASYMQKMVSIILSQKSHDFNFLFQRKKLSKFKGVVPFFMASLATVALVQGITQSRFVLPPAMPKVQVITAQLNDIQYVYPEEKALCWGTELPCALGPIEQTIKLRDPSQGIGGGFIHAR
ncbi:MULTISPECIES: LIC_10190 family membrane protein [unclassified Coleofasciculus]|uniref:LIC_10190 family membrane protein n=1 Tax=unclassified Coleofasciculus TaxID=2692782 RepID=UPI00187E6D64|nr:MULTISPECIES: hypothetical protein [unclassified Coleofasciculus]MBE9127578.1 hypothetical protein [Coleofasciculus sp. LEGE 07081]MBE9149791.1 hypothetical protein [Coleofasciculus sp. LEGE 07092]